MLKFGYCNQKYLGPKRFIYCTNKTMIVFLFLRINNKITTKYCLEAKGKLFLETKNKFAIV
jgi:hypothetical protein